MVAKNTQGWVYPLMELITQNILSKLKKTWKSTMYFLLKYAKWAHPDRDKKRDDCNKDYNPLFLKVQPMSSY